jgi:hypothetical protein
MFVLVDIKNKKVYASKSKKALAKESGFNYHSLCKYAKKGYFERLTKTKDFIFAKVDIIKSKQGGKREKICHIDSQTILLMESNLIS